MEQYFRETIIRFVNSYHFACLISSTLKCNEYCISLIAKGRIKEGKNVMHDKMMHASGHF